MKNMYKKRKTGMKRVYAPGCAFTLYKPELVDRLHTLLNEYLGEMDRLLTCCKNAPPLEPGTEVVSTCPGCDKRYRTNYEDSSNISLWEILAKSDFFPFPDYGGKKMSIIDACPVRDQARVHNAVRSVVRKMNITLIEPRTTRTKSICCGDSYWGLIPTDEVKKQMIKRTSEMPVEDIVVYCVSCSKSVFIGGKTPHYLIDLLFNEETIPQTLEPDQWHKELDDYIAKL
jgi:hypothetical protein